MALMEEDPVSAIPCMMDAQRSPLLVGFQAFNILLQLIPMSLIFTLGVGSTTALYCAGRRPSGAELIPSDEAAATEVTDAAGGSKVDPDDSTDGQGTTE